MLACAESNFSNFKFEYLCENEFLRKTILACLSGAQMGSIHEKNRGRKSRDTAPLKKDKMFQIHIFHIQITVEKCLISYILLNPLAKKLYKYYRATLFRLACWLNEFAEFCELALQLFP